MTRAAPWHACLLIALATSAVSVEATAPAARNWAVDPARSHLTFAPRLAGGEFEGRFERFDATIRFEPGDLPHSYLVVTVDLLSARTGDTDRDSSLQGTDFFQTARWPQARYSTTAIRALGGNRYQATGKLTLRDVTREVNLPFRFDPPATVGGEARLSGTTTVQRLAFGVGQGDWRDTEWLADDVRIDFALTLRASR